MLGNLVASVDQLTSNPAMADMLAKLGGNAGTLDDVFFASELRFAAAAATAAGISAVLRGATEERLTHAEMLLWRAPCPAPAGSPRTSCRGCSCPPGSWRSSASSPVRWDMPPPPTPLRPASSPSPHCRPSRPSGSSSARPCCCFGLRNRWAAFGWGVLAVTFLLGEFGPIMRLPQWLMDLSPYTHLSPLPGGSFSTGSAVVMTVLAVACAAWGPWRSAAATWADPPPPAAGPPPPMTYGGGRHRYERGGPGMPRPRARAARARAALAVAVVTLALVAGPPATGSATAAATPSPSPTLPRPTDVVDPALSVGGPALASMGIVVDRPAGVPAPPRVRDVSWLIADADTGAVLAAKAAHARLLPASTAKVLTALTLLPRIDPTARHTTTAAEAGADGTRVGLVPGMSYTAHQLFLALLMASANDAAYALADMFGGHATTLAEMNALAAALGAHDTAIGDPAGLDAPGQTSSAYDLALLGRAALQNRDFRAYSTTRTARFPTRRPTATPGRPTPTPSGPKTYQVQNHNQLLGDLPRRDRGQERLHRGRAAHQHRGRRPAAATPTSSPRCTASTTAGPTR